MVLEGYFPADNPEYSVVVITPNISHNNGRIKHQSSINKRLADRVSKKYFEIYP